MSGERRLYITLDGGDALIAKFQKLERSVFTKASREAVKLAGAPLLAAVKATTPVGPTGNLRRGVKQRIRRVRTFGEAMTNSIFTGHKIAPHVHLVKYGTKGPRKVLKKKVMSNAGRGLVKGKPGFGIRGYTQAGVGGSARATYGKKIFGGVGTVGSGNQKGTFFGRVVARMPANPWFDNAWNAHQAEMPKIIETTLVKAVTEAGL